MPLLIIWDGDPKALNRRQETLSRYAGNALHTHDHTPSGGFRNDIQGIRAVAVALVVVYHANVLLPGGFIGVDVFFVVSGFVITRMLLKELRANNTITFRRFYLRRIRRLLPALGAMLAGTLLLSILFAPLAIQQTTAKTGASAALVNANTYLTQAGKDGGYFGVAAESNPLLHTWSLAVEEQFYLFFPALLALGWVTALRRKRNAKRAITIVLALIAAVSFPLSLFITTGRINPTGQGVPFAFYSAPTRAWEFAAGGLVALSTVTLMRMGKRLATTLALSGVALLAWASLAFDEGTLFPGTAALLPVIGTVLLIAAGEAAAPNFVSRMLGTAPMQKIGDLSYSWYLWHWPFIVFAVSVWPSTSHVKLWAVVASLVPAWISYQFIERPIRFEPKPRTRNTLVLGLTCVVAPLFAALALNTAYGQLKDSHTYANFALHADVQRGCSAATPMGMRTTGDCVWETSNSLGRAVLIGDSNAGQFTEGFVSAANANHLDAEVATNSSCPFIVQRLVDWNKPDTSCTYFVSQSIAHLKLTKPKVVVIASASDGYINQPYFTFRSTDNKTAYVTKEEKIAAYQTGLSHAIELLRVAGIKVVLVNPIPKFTQWKPIEMAPIRLLGPSSWVNTSISRTNAQNWRSTALAVEKSAAKEQGISTLDFFDTLCPTARCNAFSNNTWAYRDYGHISIAASQRLAKLFTAVVTAS